MRFALGVVVLLLPTLVWADPMTPPDAAWAPDWTLSDDELFKVVVAETSTSTVGHERSIREGPASHSDADDPGPEFPSQYRSPASGKTLANGRIGPFAPVRPTARPLTAPVPLRL